VTAQQIGPTIKALRKMRGMTQRELALAVGMSRTTITNIEAGRQGVSLEGTYKIAVALGYKLTLAFRLPGTASIRRER
jgi:putative transcriptional regulator